LIKVKEGKIKERKELQFSIKEKKRKDKREEKNKGLAIFD
jgi:hypothetical protein